MEARLLKADADPANGFGSLLFSRIETPAAKADAAVKPASRKASGATKAAAAERSEQRGASRTSPDATAAKAAANKAAPAKPSAVAPPPAQKKVTKVSEKVSKAMFSGRIGSMSFQLSDVALTIAGLVLAAGSAGFAALMIVGLPESPGGRNTGALAWHRGTGVLQQLDYQPTGTVSEVPPPTSMRDSSAVWVIPYTVKSAGRDVALVEGPPGRTTSVAIGDVLPTAGRVLAIQRRDKGWVVVTTLRRIE